MRRTIIRVRTNRHNAVQYKQRMDFDAALTEYDAVRAVAYRLKMASVSGADDFRASACILRNGAALLMQGAAHDMRKHNDERVEVAQQLVDAAVGLILAAVQGAVDQTHQGP